ncbi:MAG TPA: MBOAT family protein [Candidatus Hydrogenedentes bacterium]|nr:MBOAT family protein [Candidatus Hydrogenedentota bacterium]
MFFAVVVALYFALPFRARWLLLLIASYYFYMAWEPLYALLIVASTLVDYLAVLWMAHEPEKTGRRKCLIMSLVANLGLLFTFKYFDFFAAWSNRAFGWLHVPVDIPLLDVLLPVGISFYTFQTLSYTIEVYRGHQQPERHLGRFALYVAFFPQLVAGPIERSVNLLPQLNREHAFDYGRVRDGLIRMLWGLLKKVVVADRLAVFVNHVYGAPERYPGPILVLGTVFFAFQIYCDFSGYSDIAIGAARVMGIDLIQNFRRPYGARSIPEFWRRWHISLSTWFRDYVYLPLGGRHVALGRWFSNILIVFVVSGLWHGANWTFVVWGALHGSYYIAGYLLKGVRARLARDTGLEHRPRVIDALRLVTTFLLVCLAWVFFRAESVSQAVYILTHFPSHWGHLTAYGGFARILTSMDLSVRAFVATVLPLIVLLTVEHIGKDTSIEELVGRRPVWMRWAFYVVAGFAVMNLGVPEEIPFVYFQF